MNEFQRLTIKTFGKGRYAELAKINDDTLLTNEIEKSGDYLFQDVIKALHDVGSREEAINVMRDIVVQERNLEFSLSH